MSLEQTHETKLTDIQQRLTRKCAELGELLVAKNRAYGNSAFEERTGVFSKLPTVERLFCRMDDKLARIKMGKADALGEDSYLDLAGYLVILLVKMEMDRETKGEIKETEHRCAKDKITVRRLGWGEVEEKVRMILENIHDNYHVFPVKVFGIPRGGERVLKKMLELDRDGLVVGTKDLGEAGLVVDDCVDTGKTWKEYKEKFARLSTENFNFTGLVKVGVGEWVKFPWETEEDVPAHLRGEGKEGCGDEK